MEKPEKFTWNSFTQLEQEIFISLQKAEYAISVMQVYIDVCSKLSPEPKKINLEIHKRRDANKIIAQLRATGWPLPSFNTIQKRIRDFSLPNKKWIECRGFGGKVVYYLSPEIKKQVRTST